MLILLLSTLTPVHAGRALTYDDALGLAEQANPSIQYAAATRSAAEGSVMANQGGWDPYFSLGANYAVSNESGLFQGIPYTLGSNTLVWNSGLGQTLPTGTSWSLDWVSNAQDNGGGTFGGQPVDGSASFANNLSVSLSQELLQGHRMAYNLESVTLARASLAQAEAALLEQRQQVLSGVAVAYWELVYASQALETAQEAVQVIREEKRIVDAQVAAGNLAPVESTRVAAAVAQAELALIQANNGRAAASDSLALLLGEDPGQELIPQSGPGDVPAGLDIDVSKATEAALAGNPGLVSLRVSLDNAELQLSNARHALLPSLSMNGSAGSLGFDGPDAQDDTYVPSNSKALSNMVGLSQPRWSVGANFSVPLGMRAERGVVSVQAASVTQAQINLQERERSIAQQVGVYVRTLETSRRQVQLAELNLQLAAETLAAEKARRDAGRAIEKDVLEAQRAVHDAEVESIRTRTEFRKALVQLEALQGSL